MGSRFGIKVVLLGANCAGKTSLIWRFIHGHFDRCKPHPSTIGAASYTKVMSVDEQKITLAIWDTAGSERYQSLSKIYYRKAKAAIICFDLTDDASFERAKFWVNEVRAHEENCKLYLAGTKRDLITERSIEIHNIMDYAEFINTRYYETSSQTGESIGELFQRVADEYVMESKLQISQPDIEDSGHVIKLGAASTPQSSQQQKCQSCRS